MIKMAFNIKKYMKPKVVLHWAILAVVAIVAMLRQAYSLEMVTANFLPVFAAIAVADIILEKVLKI